MARVSVEVPAELLGPVRETVLMLYEATAESLHQALRMRALDEARVHRARLEEVDELARALERGAERGAVVSASRELLHDALYGALIDAGERLADASNRSWRGELPLERVQAAAEEVLAIDALLRTL
ncbi:MAG: hypothetical protein QOE69_2348 [Thermoleophilaceae bacterium]|jgi:hypothetical protein|nr:hypothetical protein [Thermoleophilaceae bacterium]